jgi:hypothetical protein
VYCLDPAFPIILLILDNNKLANSIS